MKWFLLLACLLPCILLPACVGTTDCEVALGNCNYFGPEMMNTRFDVVGQESLQQSGVLWLATDDELAVRWDTYRVFWKANKDTVCDFPNVVPAEEWNCQRCNYCDQWVTDPMERDSVNCGMFSLTGSPDESVGPAVISYKESMMSGGPEVIAQAGYLDGCPRAPNPSKFKPGENSTLRILAPYWSSYLTERDDLEKRSVPVESLGDFRQSPPVFVTPALVEKKVHVVDGTPQQSTHQMQLHEQTDPAGCTLATNPNCTVWHKWSVRSTTVDGRTIWDVNFSDRLRIGKVRVLRIGRTNPSTGIFIPEEPSIVRPSRILFLRGFDAGVNTVLNHPEERGQRCYADTPAANTPDGNIELTHCRQNLGDATPTGEPVYTVTPTFYSGAVLTWFAEFKLSEGADADLTTPCILAAAPNPTGCDYLDANIVLSIEFTIERV